MIKIGSLALDVDKHEELNVSDIAGIVIGEGGDHAADFIMNYSTRKWTFAPVACKPVLKGNNIYIVPDEHHYKDNKAFCQKLRNILSKNQVIMVNHTGKKEKDLERSMFSYLVGTEAGSMIVCAFHESNDPYEQYLDGIQTLFQYFLADNGVRCFKDVQHLASQAVHNYQSRTKKTDNPLYR